MFNFIILDDDAVHNVNTSMRLDLIIKENSIDAKIALCTTNPDDVIAYSLKNNKQSNIYMLDVDVRKDIDGIGVAAIIREYDANAYIVFVSAYTEFVMPSLKVKIFDYLVKPVSIETLTNCIMAISKDFIKINKHKPQLFAIKSGFNMYNLNFDEIIYFEKYGHLLIVHTDIGKIESSESLENIEVKLDKMKFFRCHKSYIVNIQQIVRIDYVNNIVHLKNGEHCLVSRRCKKELLTKWV